MNSSFNKYFSSNFRRLFLLVAMVALLATVFSGCMNKENSDPSTEPSTEDSLLIEPEAEETTAPTEATEATKPQANIIMEGKMITVTGAPVEVRSAAGPDGMVIGTLEVGTQAEVLREVEFQSGSHWALVRDGWICLDSANLENGPVTKPDGPTSVDVVPPATDPIADPTPAPRPSEEKPAPKPSTNNNNNVVAGSKGVVRVNSELNVRSQPDSTSEKVGSLKNGTRVTIQETRDGWGKIDNGWISLKYVYMDGTTGTNTAKGIVTANGLNVRSGPGTEYDAVATYNAGTRVQILEQVGKWGCTKDGWISMAYVYVDGTTGDGAGSGVVTGNNLNVRSGPGTGYNAVGSLNSGDAVEILAQFDIGGHKWGCIKQGWISMDYVKMN